MGALIVLALVAEVDARLLDIIDDPRFEQGAGFGQAVAVAGTDLAIGAPGATAFGQDGAGLVRLVGSDGVLKRTFEAQTPVANAAFGSTVVVSDGLLYVSAPNDQSIGVAGLGAIYVFNLATGALVRTVRAPDPAANVQPVGGGAAPVILPPGTMPPPEAQGFGHVVVVSGGRILVGAPDSVVDGLDGAGAVYMFGADGRLLHTLREFSPSAGGSFGAALTVIGNILFVGVPGAPSVGIDGAGVVRTYDVTTGSSLATIRSRLPVAGAAFGAVLGEIGGQLFVGAPGDSALDVDNAGAVYLFDAGTRVLQSIITAPTPTSAMNFGSAIAVLGSDLVVGADGGGDDQSGLAFLIDPASGAVRTTFVPPNPRPSGNFGFALAAVGTNVAIGEPAVDAASGSGRVYLFDLTTATPGGGPSRAQSTGSAQTVPLPASCLNAPTTPSVGCRVNALLDSVAEPGNQDLARPLRQVRRAVRRADDTRGRRRARAFRRALRGVGEFMGRVEVRDAGPGMPADERAAWLAAASALQVDLGTLLSATAR